jgi:hypothetical protein
VNIGSTLFSHIVSRGLVIKKIGKKIYVKADQVDRYFNGEFEQ